ncbi:Calcium-dependent lipid-binding (CaLB domain) family protein [Raphanus sativus]|nr:Calcium-dependent lipid-binding (CaLB domain) family protein [Raphanus sativus]
MSPPELQRGRENNPTLELKIISANDVSHINSTYKMDVYAVVSITGGTTQQKQAAKTPIDFNGCSNPTWNHTVKFSIDEEAVQFTLTVKLFSYWLEDENDLYLGQVTISVQELLASNPVQPLTFPLKVSRTGLTRQQHLMICLLRPRTTRLRLVNPFTQLRIQQVQVSPFT